MRSALTVICLAAVLGGCNRAPEPGAAKAGGPRPGIPVRVAQASIADVPLDVAAIGNAEADSSVFVKSRVAGQIQKVLIADGQEVKENDILFQLDPQPFEEQIRTAEANIARDKAAEKQAVASASRDEAVAKNARLQADRYESLFKEGISSKDVVDQFRTTADAADAALAANRAAVDTARANHMADESRLAEAKMQLSYTTIRAPITGRTGFVAVKEGNLVKENDTTALVVIVRIQPIYVGFSVPEQVLPEIRRHAGSGSLLVEAVDEAKGSAIANGHLDSIDNSVDSSTGTIRIKAKFPNAERSLWPGQFVNVRMRLSVEKGVLTIPARALQSGLRGTLVWVINKEGNVEDRLVQVARSFNDVAIINKGLTPGETVVTEGQLRLRKGERAEVLKQP